ncbi:hypothetical protein L3X38_033601 [Prunus dulcis]|uniref:Uncharacterized protein n=1 Tax=Prunus dulcis TaxID=3755 RepID=A0AAD4VGH3_PRUDU|nr:hypothetical protein L3X38_033601 [Prunus dulcis]
MATSFLISLDLNLAQPTQTWEQWVAPVWMPYFGSSRGPITVNNSKLLDNNVTIEVARSLVTPRDVHVLGTRKDNRLVSDAMKLSVQSAASVASEENKELSKMVSIYSRDMQEQLEALERLGKRKRV